MYEFLFETCIFRCLNYVWIFIWSMNFLLMYFKIPYDPILRSEFVLHFSCRVKIAILTTLLSTIHLSEQLRVKLSTVRRFAENSWELLFANLRFKNNLSEFYMNSKMPFSIIKHVAFVFCFKRRHNLLNKRYL